MQSDMTAISDRPIQHDQNTIILDSWVRSIQYYGLFLPQEALNIGVTFLLRIDTPISCETQD